MRICIRPHDVGRDTAARLGAEIRRLGFDGVQLAIAKALTDEAGNGITGDPGTLTEELVSRIRGGFNASGVDIPILGAYFNPVHSNAAKARAGQEKFSDHLRLESAFGAQYVASETGSYNDDKWTYNPRNQTEEAFQAVRRVFGELAADAERYGANLSIEGAWGHCMFSPQQMARLIHEIDNGHVFTTCDLYNYLYAGNYERREQIFEDCLRLLGKKIVIFHIKDFDVFDGVLREVPVGDGIMGWDRFLPVIQHEYPDANLVFEGVPEKERSLAFVRQVLGA